jgi:chromosome segregation ATPase
LEIEKDDLAARLVEERDSRDQAQQELQFFKTESQAKLSAQKVQDETLAARVGECMQRLFAAEEEINYVRRQKETLEHELQKLKKQMEDKEQEANDVCQSLKAINEQLITLLEQERKEADHKLKDALEDAAKARSAAQIAADSKTKMEREAYEASIRAQAAAEESEQALQRLLQEAQLLRSRVSEREVQEARANSELERLQREHDANAAALRRAESAKEEMATALQQKECLLIEKKGELSLLTHKHETLLLSMEESRDVKNRLAVAESQIEEARGQLCDTQEKLTTATEMAEEFMDRSEAAERRVESLERDLEIAQAANALMEEQRQQLSADLAERDSVTQRARALEIAQGEQFAALQKQHADLQKAFDDLERQRLAELARHGSKEKEMEATLGSLRELEARMRDEKQGTLEKIDKLSTHLIQVQDEYAELERGHLAVTSELDAARLAASEANRFGHARIMLR